MKDRKFFALVAGVILSLVAVSCGGGSATTTPPGTNPSSTTATSTSSSYSQMAELGIHVYQNSCSRCHGSNGQGGIGPALVGNSNTHLAYPTASALLSKISSTMPQDKPGTLTQAEYYQVLGYILLQNNWVTAQSIFNANNLSQILLK
jgi:mono/diheme cytochrome c family protein